MHCALDKDTLEKEYSPSSCVTDINEYIQRYVIKSRDNKLWAKTRDLLHESIPYSNKSTTTFDMYLPIAQAENTETLVVYIHGGYWQELTKAESSFSCNAFQQQGHHVAVLDYTLAPKATLSEIVDEVRKAVAFLYLHCSQWGYDANKIILAGSSAGAHLAIEAALTDWSLYFDENAPQQNIVKGVIAVSGIYDISPIQKTYINDALSLTQEEITKHSPLLNTSDFSTLKGCFMLLAYGDNETQSFKEQTNALSQQLTNVDIKNTCMEIAGRNHFDVIMDLANTHTELGAAVHSVITRCE